MNKDIFNYSTMNIVDKNTCFPQEKMYYSQNFFNNNMRMDLYSSMYHTVAPGETLWSIANRYGLTVEDLKRFNNLVGDTVLVGQILYLQEPGENDHFTVHTVMAGETLWTIASRYGTTVDVVRTLNNLTGDTISVGQRLIVPRRETITYSVRPGDTLFSIARAFGTTVARLKSLNNLVSDLIQVGQVLIIS